MKFTQTDDLFFDELTDIFCPLNKQHLTACIGRSLITAKCEVVATTITVEHVILVQVIFNPTEQDNKLPFFGKAILKTTNNGAFLV